jgi:glutamyl-tRNA reductase
MVLDNASQSWADPPNIDEVRAYACFLGQASAADIAELIPLVEQLSTARDDVAVVATCSRIEVYASRDLVELEDEPRFIRFQGSTAVERLATVAAGAESIVAGETDILAQVRTAFRASRHHLRKCCDIAVSAARDARASVSFESRDAGGQLEIALRARDAGVPASISIVGTGAMARHLARSARTLGIQRVRVCGRDLARAKDCAASAGGEGISIDVLANEYEAGCLVLAFKGTPSLALKEAILASAAHAAAIVDLTMPPFSWPPELASRVTDLEALAGDMDGADAERGLRDELRAAALAAVRRQCPRLDDDGPAMAIAMYRHIERVRMDEISRSSASSDAEHALAERVTRSLIKKLFHTYGKALRGDEEPSLVETTRRFFLPPDGEDIKVLRQSDQVLS